MCPYPHMYLSQRQKLQFQKVIVFVQGLTVHKRQNSDSQVYALK